MPTTPGQIDLRVELYSSQTDDDGQHPLLYALGRGDLVFLSLPHGGDRLSPVALWSEDVPVLIPGTPHVHHVEHFPTQENGKALGASTVPVGASFGSGSGATVVVHGTTDHLEDDDLARLRRAGWYVSELSRRS